MESIEWDGRIWVRGNKDGYFRSDKYFHWHGRWLHREVWRKHNGPIPRGYEIHHRDHNPANNDLSNLECLTKSEHGSRHKWDDDRRETGLPHLDRIRPFAAAWHKTDEGRRMNAISGAMAYQSFSPEEKTCGCCGEIFTPRKLGSVDKFCSNRCRAADRRASGVDNEIRQCGCGATFSVSRFSKSQSCSRSCAMRLRAKRMRTVA